MKNKDLQFLGCFKGRDVFIKGTKEDAEDITDTFKRAIQELDMYRAIENAERFNKKYPEKKKSILDRWFFN